MSQANATRDLPAWIRSAPIAHRGLHGRTAGVPENSLAAFERAAAAGCPIELDVHLLADGRVAVFHDTDLRRMTGDGRPIADCTAQQVRQLRLEGTDQPIPLLEEVFELAAGRTPLLIEIKNPSREDRRPEAAVAALLAGYEGPAAVQSFNALSVRWFAEHAPLIPRGQLASDFSHDAPAATAPSRPARFEPRYMPLARQSRPAFIAYDVRCLLAWAPGRRRPGGLPIVAWTIRSQAEMAEALRHSDNVIFEGFLPLPPPGAR